MGKVLIGLTSDEMANSTRNRRVKKFVLRKKQLIEFIEKEFKVKPEIEKIENKFGPTLKKDFDYIVVSPQTHKTALLINKKRKELNKKAIKIIKIKFVLDKYKKPISSTNILNG